MPRFINEPQGSQGWHDARAGSGTASRFADIMAGKGARETYLDELVAERLGGPLRDSGGMAKEWGHGSEPLAREAYMVRTGEIVREVGLAIHDRIKWVAASSDGLVGTEGSIEIKCPFNSGVHVRTMRLGMPEAHWWQVMGNMWVLNTQWLDFCSYDPAFSPPHNLYIERIQRNESSIKHLSAEVKKFLAEVEIATRDILASQK